MKIIPTKLHGFLDYFVAAILIALPWIFNLERDSAETFVPVALGVATIVYSIFTAYELGISKAISMRTHLLLDFLNGLFLAASPWIFGFADQVYLPHLILGIMEIVVSVTTKTLSVISDQSQSME